MTVRSRLIRFLKRVLRVGKANDRFSGGPKRRPSVGTAAAEFESLSQHPPSL